MILFRNHDFESNEILLKWREDVFRFIRISLLFGGSLSITLSVIIYWNNMSYGFVLMQGVVLAVILFVNIAQKSTFSIRLYLTVFMFYVVAGLSLYNIGVNGQFWLWLLTTTIILTVFRQAFFVFSVLVLNFLLLTVIGIFIHFEFLRIDALTDFSLSLWMLNSTMFIWVNATFIVIMLMARNIILSNFLKEKEIRQKREEETLVLLRTKAELKQSEAFYKEAEQMAHLGSWRLDFVKKKAYWSEEVYKMFCRDPKLGTPSLADYIKYVHPDDREYFSIAYNDRILKADSIKFEYRVLLEGGITKYIEGVGRRILGEHDKVIGLFGTFMDITDRKVREIQLVESEAFYKEAEKLASLGSWKLDLLKNQVIWSEETYKIFMRNPALGAPLLNEYLQYIHPSERKLYYKRHLEALKSTDPLSFGFRVLLKGNIVKYIEGTAQKKVDDRNNVIEMYGILMDVTERKLREVKIKEREISYKEAQELAHLGHWEYNANTDMTYWSDELYRILSWDLGKPAPKVKEYLNRIHPEDLDNYKERVKMWMDTPEKDFFEFRYFASDGGIRYLEVITRKRTDNEGNVEHLYGTMLDITERVSARNQLEENLEKLNKKNEELDKFSYSTSHELRAPITSALGLTNLMRLEFGKDVHILEYIEMLEKSLKRLDDFITEIADFSRNEKYEVEFSEINITDMVEQTVSELSFMEGADKIEYTLKPTSKLLLYSDKLRLQVILSNLISNAIKYHDLEKKKPEININIENNSDKFIITCADNGLGIDDDHQKKVFDMFFTTGSKSYGTGLGLYILQESVSKLSGKVKFESEKGKGTTFIIEIPNE